ncbi:MAG TPA: hypothetical protein VG435_13385, partial [Acidimicrobiales bacterium]|nr:hypothetical protein [Acidimicrobiales bacterium]
SQFVIGEAVRCESLSDRARVVGRFEPFHRKPMAERAFREIKDGTLPGFSFAFKQGRATPHPRVKGAVVYRSARMENWGPVHRPSIPGAVATGIRSMPPGAAEELRRVLARFGVDSGRRSVFEDYECRRLANEGLTKIYNRQVREAQRAMLPQEMAILSAEIAADRAAEELAGLDLPDRIDRALARMERSRNGYVS